MLFQFAKRMWGFIVAIVAVTQITLVLHYVEYPFAAQLVSTFGVAVVMLCTVAYVVFYDSKRRWPGLSTFKPWTRLVTFQR